MDRIENAIKLKHNGYNCAQAVIMSYKDLLNIDDETLMKLSSGFAIGMGNMEATCGALIGANIVLGLLNNNQPTIKKSKKLISRFKELSKATICNVLKGTDTGIVLTPCDDCIKNAIIALDELLEG